MSVPGPTPATRIQPLVYAADDLMLVIARDWVAQASRDYAPAFKADKVALTLSGRFAVAAPVPARSLRKLTVTP